MHRNLKIFVLELMYPAIVGALLVLIFIRYGDFGVDALVDKTFHLGVVVLVFFSMGYVHSKSCQKASSIIILADAATAAIAFHTFHLLGYNQPAEQIADLSPSSRFHLLVVFILIPFIPAIRRALVGEFILLDIRNALAILASSTATLTLLLQFDLWILIIILELIIVIALTMSIYGRQPSKGED